jgi:hypothetical protein
MPEESGWAGLTTIGDAAALVDELFDRQIDRAELDGMAPNASAPGDGEARTAFLMLLPPNEQRATFLRRAKNRRFWPRVRTLIGSPPFSFLRAEDAGVLRAGGIDHRRVNMAHATPSLPSSSEFGSAQFSDATDRDWKFVFSAESASSAVDRAAVRLPFVNLVPGDKVVAEVRIRKRTQAAKVEILRGRNTSISKESLTFPGLGKVVHLVPVSALRGVGEVGLRVGGIAPRGNVARIFCVVT